MPLVWYTIGHSRRALDDFVRLLQAHGVKKVVDVRSIPRSASNPQFNRETLPADLRRLGIGYVHLPGLGGWRRPRPGSPNTGWRNPSFQGYADYMQTPEFEENLQKLLGLAQRGPAALMCAEAVPWRCHRSLIADALVARDIPVQHILSASRCQPHVLCRWARVKGTRLFYPAAETALD